jgi:hypothetical protein
MCSFEVTLHINDEVKGHNVRIWRTENPHVKLEQK